MTQTNYGELKMGVSKIRFAMLSCIGGALAMTGSVNAQQAIPAAYRASAPAPVVYQDAVQATDCGCTSAVAAPMASAGCSTGGCGVGSRIGSRLGNIGGCGLGSRIGSGCGGGCDIGDQWKLFGSDCDDPVLNIGGWFQGGYHEESNDLFNNQPGDFNLHQGWLFVEKVAEAQNGNLGFGFRFDGMYGIDAADTQAFGNTVDAGGRIRGFDNGFNRGGGYGWAIPQAYLEVAGENWSAKVGHFYTLIGYEVVTAPDNFFYSNAITMYNSEPFTHTGALGTFNLTDDVTAFAGWTLGWDTGFDQFADGSSFIGGFSMPLGEDTTMTYINTIGDFGARGSDAYSHSFVFDTALTDRLNWVVQSDLLRVGSTGEDNVGLNQYLIYTVNDCISVGSRLEWWKGDTLTGYAPHGGVLPAEGSHSYYASTFGVNLRATANVIVRPEYRVDWSPALGYDEGYFGVDVIALF
jgi:hypothetical protein